MRISVFVVAALFACNQAISISEPEYTPFELAQVDAEASEFFTLSALLAYAASHAYAAAAGTGTALGAGGLIATGGAPVHAAAAAAANYLGGQASNASAEVISAVKSSLEGATEKLDEHV